MTRRLSHYAYSSFLQALAGLAIALAAGGTSAAEQSFRMMLEPYDLRYEATYRGFSADATRSLDVVDPGKVTLSTFIELTLLGRTITSIEENAELRIEGSNIVPLSYSYVQEGIGSRTRGANFNWDQNVVIASVDERSEGLPLEGSVLDEVSALLFLRKEVSVGATEISYRAVSRDEIEEYLYEVVGREEVDTPVGRFETIRVNRIRDPGSERSTSFWLAPAWGYTIVRLEQIDPDGGKLELEVSGGEFNGVPIKGE